MFFQNPGYQFNDTVLHQQLRAQISYAQLQGFVNEIGEDIASYLSTITNDRGELPIDLCETYTDKYEYLLYLMMQKPYLQLNEKVKVIQSESVPRTLVDRKLQLNINRASRIATIVRDMFATSTTHPEINYASSFVYNQITSLIIDERRLYTYSSTTYAAAESVFSTVDKTRVGNCYEYAHCAYFLMRQSNSRVPADIFIINKSDHVFLVIGRANDSDPGEPLSWGKAAVVCDAWAGLVYPVTEMNYYLNGFKRYSSHILDHDANVLPTYNPRYHSFRKNDLPGDIKNVTSNRATLFHSRVTKRTIDVSSEGKHEHTSKRICVKKN